MPSISSLSADWRFLVIVGLVWTAVSALMVYTPVASRRGVTLKEKNIVFAVMVLLPLFYSALICLFN